ncbi:MULTISPECIES: complex I 51 kDa subunit family protein [Clostridium]|nr:NADH-ubiquinone oxidoreductase-F iron-sulfur binding region domain-containing protein [Clostridium cadaveris]MDU4953792.1 NADH-ubiquinone oxidoreductase-F iron-sulfur binding region domain-containing protein [Clostridium sp.]MDM8310924.1 NADH-ubiquinone oxidoreductase-F iron-sulfur binding region domain-containing protein [Clostridium cadaveris]MDY4947933.1 NADH-ubiquinone oxidoreductase-F iron-sulfur binding region domain-containing protein [Clostridium cadaveris]NME63416.1 NADH-quinone oxi
MAKTVKYITKDFGTYDVNSIDSYEKIGGFAALRRATNMDGYDIAKLISLCKVKGRGGAAYDMGKKWSQAKDISAPKKVVVCNADEGEPCTFKDRTIIQNDPFRLIEGIIIAGYSVDAHDGYIYLREEYKHLRPLLLNAINQAEEKGYLGRNILGKDFNFKIHLYSGAGAYVCGEGTALVESIEGKSGRPRMKPPFIKQCGLFKLPTLVNNVESLSLVPSILLDDSKEYLTYGTEGSVGTKLVSVGGNVRNPGVFEIPFGITLREIIYELAGGIIDNNEIRLVQLGGASGKIASPKILDIPYTYEDLRKVGLTVGSGAILVVDKRTSVLEFLKATQEFFSHESCGQCTPCREGNLHISLILDKCIEGTAKKKDIANLEKFANIMCDSSLCGLGETAQSALLSAMHWFKEEFEV